MGVVIHSHPVYDSDEHYTIDPISRNITNVKSKKTSLIQYDHNSERFSFDIPRYVEGHDMTLCNKVEIHYLNLDSMKRERRVGVYEVEDLMVTTEDDQVAVFTWLISQNCTELAGSLSYIIMFACVEDGETTYRWHTAINASIIIAKGMNNEEAITAPLEFPDILQQWKEELFTKDWAYESAKSHGFEGTAEEWLASLHGADGYSPAILVREVEGGHQLVITDYQGSKTVDVMDGEDGYAPVALVTDIEGGHRLTITDRIGTKTVDIMDGEDGYAPVALVTDIDGGHRLTITDRLGSKSVDIINGTNGKDGYSPAVLIREVTGGHELVITDYQGSKTVSIMDGVDGKDGADGYSPTVTTAAIANGTTVTITDVNGAHSFNVLNGSDGKDGTNGTNGKDGTNGVDGDDGISPTVTVTDISGGHRITITDANGSKSFDVMNGTNEISEAVLDYMSTYVYIGEIEPTSGPTLWFDTSSRS